MGQPSALKNPEFSVIKIIIIYYVCSYINQDRTIQGSTMPYISTFREEEPNNLANCPASPAGWLCRSTVHDAALHISLFLTW